MVIFFLLFFIKSKVLLIITVFNLDNFKLAQECLVQDFVFSWLVEHVNPITSVTVIDLRPIILLLVLFVFPFALNTLPLFHLRH